MWGQATIRPLAGLHSLIFALHILEEMGRDYRTADNTLSSPTTPTLLTHRVGWNSINKTLACHEDISRHRQIFPKYSNGSLICHANLD